MAKTRKELPYLPYPRQDVTQVINQHRFLPAGSLDPLSTWGNFDGVDDHVALVSPVAPVLYPLSMFAWIKTTAASDRVMGMASSNGHYISVNTHQTAGPQVNRRFGATQDTVSHTSNTSDGEWHHVGVVVHSDTSLTIYFDGIGVTHTGISVVTDGYNQMFVGAHRPIISSTFEGEISDARFFDAGLTVSEVAYLHSLGVSGDEPSSDGLIAHYEFGDGSGTTVTDSSGNGNDGTANNIDPVAFWGS